MDVNFLYQYVTLKPWVGKFLHPVLWSFVHLQTLENGQYIKQNHPKEKKQETESKYSTRVKNILLGSKEVPFSAIFDSKNDLNFIAQEIALKEVLNISPYTSKSTDNSLKPIGKIKNLEVTFENEEKTYLDFLLFENFNQIIVEENSSILSSSKEIIPAVTHIKSKEKEKEDKLEVEDSEAIERIKEGLKKMRRNLDMAIEDPEKAHRTNLKWI
ncbi:hypothetical protein O181_023347 [Austropuccinia psidii MF-1]|uniref:Uncharacterized protein n=1 Tax=Austropuccinia psidii MF-1 TaxID=1389203 RepID=A0A9Q3CJC5_9BASI|nr:hypothetical protein [Austropuccinia psidii MF-1]